MLCLIILYCRELYLRTAALGWGTILDVNYIFEEIIFLDVLQEPQNIFNFNIEVGTQLCKGTSEHYNRASKITHTKMSKNQLCKNVVGRAQLCSWTRPDM